MDMERLKSIKKQESKKIGIKYEMEIKPGQNQGEIKIEHEIKVM